MLAVLFVLPAYVVLSVAFGTVDFENSAGPSLLRAVVVVVRYVQRDAQPVLWEKTRSTRMR